MNRLRPTQVIAGWRVARLIGTGAEQVHVGLGSLIGVIGGVGAAHAITTTTQHPLANPRVLSVTAIGIPANFASGAVSGWSFIERDY